MPANRRPAFVPFAPLPMLMLASLAWLGLSACTLSHARLQTDDPELAEYVQLVMPAKIKILEWTKPVSLAGDGQPDALEVILEARDSFDDLTKVVGTFHFELQTRRLSGPIGARVAFWPVEIKSEKTMRMYRDRLSRFYHFPLELDEKPLRPGRYSLSVRLHLPTGQRLFDEYEFEYDGGSVPPANAF
ncbi:MAG: hypothetical protein KAY37_08185 [Phycisphaerae bacterium]|nr:hypothetical protein [Phycisphaerae bacterium]